MSPKHKIECAYSQNKRERERLCMYIFILRKQLTILFAQAAIGKESENTTG